MSIADVTATSLVSAPGSSKARKSLSYHNSMHVCDKTWFNPSQIQVIGMAMFRNTRLRFVKSIGLEPFQSWSVNRLV